MMTSVNDTAASRATSCDSEPGFPNSSFRSPFHKVQSLLLGVHCVDDGCEATFPGYECDENCQCAVHNNVSLPDDVPLVTYYLS